MGRRRIVDESKSLLVRRRPIGVAGFISDVAIQGRRRSVKQFGHRAAFVLSQWKAPVLILAWILTARSGSVDTEIQAQLDLRLYAIMRGETQTMERPPLQLPRGRVLLTLLLPTGSEPGPYDVEIRDSRAVLRTSARGDAELRNQATTLGVSVSTQSLSPGAYQLAVRHVGDEWQQFPLKIEWPIRFRVSSAYLIR